MIVSLVLGWAFIYVSRTCLYPLFPVIAEELGVTSAQAGLLSSVYFTSYTILQIPAGLLMDRLGTKKCLASGCAASGIALLCAGLWGSSYGTLLFFLGVQGAGDSFFYTAAQATVVTHSPPKRKNLYSALLGMGMSAGVLAGLGLSHSLYAAFADYRAPFLLSAFPMFAAAGMTVFFVPDVPPSRTARVRDYVPLFRDADLWRISGAMFCLLYGFWACLNWGPTFLRVERGFVAEQAGFYSGLIALASIPGGLLWSRLTGRLGRRAVLMTALPLCALFLCCVANARSFPAITASLMAFGFCSNTAVVPVAVLWISQIAGPRYPGRVTVAIAFFNCVLIASAVAAPALSGLIRDVSGSLAGAIFLAAGVVLSGLLFLYGAREAA
ncbi:MAG: MFS transporter [Synergistaceae bacterium]|nr:MFS transporter [Synergistaceae bacterium]